MTSNSVIGISVIVGLLCFGVASALDKKGETQAEIDEIQKDLNMESKIAAEDLLPEDGEHGVEWAKDVRERITRLGEESTKGARKPLPWPDERETKMDRPRLDVYRTRH